MTIIISIDGNIGIGKTTIINNLKKKFINNKNIIFLEEPVNEWIKITDGDKNIIEKFYEDPNKYAFAFQMLALISRFKIINDTIQQNQYSIIITERSLYTDKYIFAKMLYESSNINTIEYQIYNKWFDEYIDKLPIHKFIYLYAMPHTCNERIKLRARDGENNIDINYINNCNKYHEEMFTIIYSELKINLNNCNINTSEYNESLYKISSYILSHII